MFAISRRVLWLIPFLISLTAIPGILLVACSEHTVVSHAVPQGMPYEITYKSKEQGSVTYNNTTYDFDELKIYQNETNTTVTFQENNGDEYFLQLVGGIVIIMIGGSFFIMYGIFYLANWNSNDVKYFFIGKMDNKKFKYFAEIILRDWLEFQPKKSRKLLMASIRSKVNDGKVDCYTPFLYGDVDSDYDYVYLFDNKLSSTNAWNCIEAFYEKYPSRCNRLILEVVNKLEQEE